jgi:RHS repeat-associated protein
MGYPPNRIARLDANKNLHYYFADHLGSERVVQNSTGSACEQDIDYYPYGGVQNDYCPSASQTYKFTGAERDGATGLDALGVRNYSSSLARFMTPDPGHASGLAHPENPQSWNPYSYAVNNPLKFTDTSGFGYCHYKNMSDQQSAEDAKLELGEKQDTPGWCKKHQGEWIYESGETQIVQNNTGSAPIQTPSTEVTVNGVSGEVRYLSFYFQGSDLPIRPEAQIIMRTVGQLTGGYTKQGNCVAGLI